MIVNPIRYSNKPSEIIRFKCYNRKSEIQGLSIPWLPWSLTFCWMNHYVSYISKCFICIKFILDLYFSLSFCSLIVYSLVLRFMFPKSVVFLYSSAIFAFLECFPFFSFHFPFCHVYNRIRLFIEPLNALSIYSTNCSYCFLIFYFHSNHFLFMDQNKRKKGNSFSVFVILWVIFAFKSVHRAWLMHFNQVCYVRFVINNKL